MITVTLPRRMVEALVETLDSHVETMREAADVLDDECEGDGCCYRLAARRVDLTRAELADALQRHPNGGTLTVVRDRTSSMTGTDN